MMFEQAHEKMTISKIPRRLEAGPLPGDRAAIIPGQELR